MSLVRADSANPDYTYAIEALKIGQPVKIVLLRNQERLTMEVTPGSRK